MERAKEIFETGPQFLLSPAKVSNDLAASVITACESGIERGAAESGKLEALQNTMKLVPSAVVNELVQSPYLQVISLRRDQSHEIMTAFVRMRLTIPKILRGHQPRRGQGYYLTPIAMALTSPNTKEIAALLRQCRAS